MFKDRVKFLGLCVLISSILLSISLIINVFNNRYSCFTLEGSSSNIVFDTLSGKVFVTSFSDGKPQTRMYDLTSVTVTD